MNFIKQINVDNGTLVCSFVKSFSASGVKYYVNLVDTNSRANLFAMELIHNRWKIVNVFNIPGWIRSLESRLEQFILEDQAGAAYSQVKRTVLHIDDDEEDRLILEGAFKQLDSQIIVRQADSGDAALSFLQHSKNFNDLPHLIVLDLKMPGMNGTEIVREIKKDKQLASLPLVIYTTASEKAYRDLLSNERLELLTKPSSPSELMNSVKKMLSYCHLN